MGAVLSNLEFVLEHAIEIIELLLEYIGVCIILVTAIRGLIHLLKKSPRTKLILGEGFTMALSFMLGGEILGSVAAKTLPDIAVVGGIIALRVAMVVLLHWEMGHEKGHSGEEKKEH